MQVRRKFTGIARVSLGASQTARQGCFRCVRPGYRVDTKPLPEWKTPPDVPS
jgi:hypothetical protein